MTQTKRKKLNVKTDSIFGEIRTSVKANVTPGGQGILKTLPLDVITLDPLNARSKHKVSPEDIKKLLDTGFKEALDTKNSEACLDHHAITSVWPTQKKQFLVKIIELAKSIETNGLIHPVSVVSTEKGYALRAGERRYLAHLYSGYPEIKAFIRQPSHNKIDDRIIALIENVQREDLTTGELITGIYHLNALYEEQHRKKLTGIKLSEILHKSQATCARYLRIIHAPDDIYHAVSNDDISLSEALDILSLPPDDFEKFDVQRFIQEKQSAENPDENPDKEKKISGRQHRAAPASISFKIEKQHSFILKDLMDSYLKVNASQTDAESIKELTHLIKKTDWHDPQDVKQLWLTFLKKIAP